MLSHQFLQTCEANAHLTILQNQYTVLKMQTRIMQTQQLLGFFSIWESTLRGILKRRIRRSDKQKKDKLGQKSVLKRRIKRQLLGRVNRNPIFRLFDLLLTARRLVSKPTSHRFVKNRIAVFERIEFKSLAVLGVLSNARKNRRVNWCRRPLLVDFTKLFLATKLSFPFDLVKNSEAFTLTEKLKTGQKCLL